MVQSATKPNACPHCGCDCSVISLGPGCGLGRSAPPADAPVALIDGKAASLDEAVERAAAILAAARFPLVYGLTRLTCEAQRAAVALADRIGGCIDIAGSCPAPLFPDLGTVSCSLGEVKNRADLIVFWGGRPDVTHPRLREFFEGGRFVQGGRDGRTVAVIGDRALADAFSAEMFLPAAADGFAAIWLLRALVRGQLAGFTGLPVCGISMADWKAFALRLKRCHFGVLFFDAVIGGPRFSEAAHGLATDLNAFTRFYALTLRSPGNGVGAEQVLTWQTGYPSAVSLSGGHPRSFADEFSAERVLTRGEADAALLIGAGVNGLSAAAQNLLRRIPVIALTPQITTLANPASVAITTVACANPLGGTAFRLDGLALPLRPAFSSSFPDDFQVTLRIEQVYRRMKTPG
jgi:formylmethanofuran dehydrogenase subunit B